MRTLVVFVTVAVAGMALLPETPAHAGVGKDPATAYAPAAVADTGTVPIVCSDTCGDGHADMRGSLVVASSR